MTQAGHSTAARHAVECAIAGIRAVDPFTIVVDALAEHALGERVAVVAIGKAAATMAKGAYEVLGASITRGIVVAPTVNDAPSPMFTTFCGGHPVPNAEGERGAQAILELATSLGADETLLVLVSGGASALVTLPAESLTLADLQALTDLLLRAGATINELNCVRKHVDRLKGGRLACLAAPARVVALVLSDVIGDPLDVIASGPTVPDPTTVDDAMAVLRAHGVWDTIPAAIRAHLLRGEDESPKPDDARFATVTSSVIGNNVKAAEAACAHARSLGYEASVVTTALDGESRDVGATIVHTVLAQRDGDADRAKPVCLVYAGETTVTVRGKGQGGRNQELALAAAMAIETRRDPRSPLDKQHIAVASVGTDGIDGPTDAAGAVADETTVRRATSLGLNSVVALYENDAYPYWKTLGDLVMTGPTGTNVMDLVVAIAS